LLAGGRGVARTTLIVTQALGLSAFEDAQSSMLTSLKL